MQTHDGYLNSKIFLIFKIKMADCLVDEDLNNKDFDIIILPGGGGGAVIINNFNFSF